MLELKSPILRATFSTLGARLVSLHFDNEDMLQGGASDDQFLEGDWTAGAICGRFAGRISHARFTLDGLDYNLIPNMGQHQLHGGPDNFAIRHWNVQATDQLVRFSLTSPDNDQGFPGQLEVSAAYALNNNTLSLELEARTTQTTVLNLTNHAYWNLSGGARNAFDHQMKINGPSFLPLDDLLLPTGEICDLAGTRWDFRKLRKVSEPYDNCWLLDGPRGALKHALTLRDPETRRTMEVWTTEPALQMYTALHWNEGMPGRKGPLKQYAAIAIEPQNAPDAPNHENFPSAILRPGEVYRHRIEWRFS